MRLPVIRKGFTLIELLIVVAIIAILAAIAVPNFLEAQVRAKVSRARADMRSAATAIEAYTVDNNKPPMMRFIDDADAQSRSGRAVHDYICGPGQSPGSRLREFNEATLPIDLTTPVAYLTSLFNDPFKDSSTRRLSPTTMQPLAGQAGVVVDISDLTTLHFTYHNILALSTEPGYDTLGFSSTATPPFRSDLEEYGSWRLTSVGPDKNYVGSIGRRIYDPTNGTVTPGDIIRTQSSSAGVSNETTTGSN